MPESMFFLEIVGMNEVLDRLKSGIQRFQQELYPSSAQVYRRAATEPQKPHTLMITCADSRIDVEKLTSAGPGEIFTMRNIGNIVPEHGDRTSGDAGAVIEYAVSYLKVKHAVICGHSDCGAMKALQAPESLNDLPTVRNWLTHARAAQMPSSAQRHSSGETLDRLTERNVLLQIEHLKTHPAVAAALTGGVLTISGWVYDIGSGKVRIAEDGSATFRDLAGRGRA